MVLGHRLLIIAFSASSSPPRTLIFRSPSRCSKQGEISTFVLVLRSGLDSVLDLLSVSLDFGLARGKLLGGNDENGRIYDCLYTIHDLWC